MKTLKFFVAAVAAFMTMACAQEEIDVLTMGSTEINVSYQGAKQTLSFSTNAAWTIEADENWVSFDAEEGTAGDAEVVMTIAANTTYETRTAVVTITAGGKFTEYVIKQGYASEFAADMKVNLDFKAQAFKIDVNSNLAYEVTLSEGAESWITSDDLTKAAPEKKTLTFNVAMNTGETRSAVIYIKAEGVSQTVLVTQGPVEPIHMTSVKATYLGKTSYIYDSENWIYPEFDEHFLEFANESGDKLTISLNNKMSENALAAIPAGKYVADASGAHQASTFTLNDGSAKYYTSATVSGVSLDVVDGTVSVEVSGESYKIVAELYDVSGVSYSFDYSGELPEMEDKSFGADIVPTFDGQYDTYFTTKANKWSVTFYISKKAPGADVFLQYFQVDFYSPENVDPAVLPEGTYTLATPETSTEFTYANGITLAEPGMMTYFYGNDSDYNTVDALEGSKIVVTKNTDGTYNFAVDFKLHNWYWDEEYNRVDISDFDYAAEFKNIEIGEVPAGGMNPTPDADAVFSTVMSSQYVGLWWGDKWETGGSAFTIGFSGAAVNSVYEIYLTINQSVPYNFDPTFGGRYSVVPLETGVYTFSKTPAAGERSLVPVLYGTTNSYCYVMNSYTGSKMPITGGSITLNADTIEYDIEATFNGEVYKFTGSHAASLYYARDYVKNAKNINIVE